MNVKLTEQRKIKLLNSDDVFEIMQKVLGRENKIDRDKEHFWIIGLANNNKALFIELVSIGSVKTTVIEPMNVFRVAILKNAVKVILVHNHPSGELTPSEDDKDVTDRLIQVARQVVSNPSASLPNQTATWGDLKAAYKLFDRQEVTFDAIARPHWELTKQRTAGRYLVIGDTTEIDFGKRKMISGLGPTGNGSGAGFLLHNALMVDAHTEEIIGVAGQTIHYRDKKSKSKKKASRTQRLKRKRESEVWNKVIDQVGPPPEDRKSVV